MPFKVGELVRVRVGQGQRHKDQPLNEGDIHEVQVEAVERDHNPLIGIKGFRRMFFAKRFEKHPAHAEVGLIPEPVAVAIPEVVALPVIEVEEIPEVVAIPIFKVGDKVRITAKVEDRDNGNMCHWAGNMDNYLNNGNAYPIIRAMDEGKYQVDFGDKRWWFLAECFTLAEEEIAPIEQAPVAAAPVAKPKPVKKKEATTFRAKVMQAWKIKNNKQPAPVNNLCSYALEKEDGEILYFKNDICHYRLQNAAKIKSVLLGLWRTEYDLKDKGVKEKELPEYYDMWLKYADYIINHSPFKVAFHGQRMSTIVRYGVLMNTDVSIDKIGGGAIALRGATEFPHKLPVFNDALKAGFSGDVAYLMCNMLTKGADGNYNVATFGGGHQEFYARMHSDDVFKFVAKGYDEDMVQHKKPYREYSQQYAIYASIARQREGNEMDTWMTNNIKKEVVGQGWNQKTFVSANNFKQLGELLTKTLNEKKEEK